MKDIGPGAGPDLRDIYKEYLPMVYRIAFTYMKNSSDSEDAVVFKIIQRIKLRQNVFQNNVVEILHCCFVKCHNLIIHSIPPFDERRLPHGAKAA